MTRGHGKFVSMSKGVVPVNDELIKRHPRGDSTTPTPKDQEAVDRALDEIDQVLEENAEAFVRSYVQRGAQGWSAFLTPQFFQGAAMAGIVGGATYDSFKLVIQRVVKASRQFRRNPDEDYGLEEGLELALRESWITADRLINGGPVQHSMDEATALHWLLFWIEFQKEQCLVRLRKDHYRRVKRVGASFPESLTPSQAATRILEEWFQEHPNAGGGRPGAKRSASKRAQGTKPPSLDVPPKPTGRKDVKQSRGRRSTEGYL